MRRIVALPAQPDTDLVLLDLHMPGSHGLMGVAAIRAEQPACASVRISAHNDPVVKDSNRNCQVGPRVPRPKVRIQLVV